MSPIFGSTPLVPQQESFYLVGHKQTLGAGHNTSGLTVMCRAKKTQFFSGYLSRVTTHSLHSPTHCYSNQKRRHTIRVGSRDLSIDTHTQTHTKTPNTRVLIKKRKWQKFPQSLALLYTQINTHTTHKGSSGGSTLVCLETATQ